MEKIRRLDRIIAYKESEQKDKERESLINSYLNMS